MTECDSCGQRTYLHAVKGSLELNFCRHHGLRNNDSLSEDGWTLHWDVKGIEHLTPGIKVPV